MVSAPVLPPEHVHLAGIEGRTQVVVHSHTDGGFASTSSSATLVASHGDHGRAVFLTSVSDRAARQSAHQMWLPTAVALMPAFVEVDVPHTDVRHRIHGPPGRVWLSRGPPSFLS